MNVSGAIHKLVLNSAIQAGQIAKLQGSDREGAIRLAMSTYEMLAQELSADMVQRSRSEVQRLIREALP